MAGYRVISSDNHVMEPPDLWQSRIEPKFRERAPHTVREDDGDWWYCDGLKITTGFGFGGAQTGRRFEEPGELTTGDVFENVRPGGYIPEEQIKDMDLDGVDVSILYPTLGLQLFKVPDGELLTAIFRTYNDWLAEFCQTSPKRLTGIAMVNVDDVQVGVQELERCRKLGFVGAMITVYPPEQRRYDSPEYEPLWAAAQDLRMPLGLHAATNRFGSGEGDRTSTNRFAVTINFDHYVRMSLTDMIFSGVFERYPNLQIGAVEHEISWAAHFLDRIDYNYNQRARGITGYRFKDNMLPSDFFHRNVFLGFQEDPLGIRLRDIIGVDSLMWGSDYPHHESTFPRSREILEEILAECTEEEKAKIAGGNAARVYNLT
jgi:predicted TIM-barrel fold metal-dependent hydrolase